MIVHLCKRCCAYRMLVAGLFAFGIGRQLRAMVLSPVVSQRLGTFITKENDKDLRVLAELIAAGTLRPVIDRTYPLAEAPEAIRHLQEGRARGKVVIAV